MKRKKKTERQLLILACDNLFRQILLIRDNAVCQYSGRKNNLQVSHFISRENLHLRWNEDNACIINGGVHIFTFHKYPHIHREFTVKRIGEEKVLRFEMIDRIRTKPLYTCEIRIIKKELAKFLLIR